LAFCVPTSPFVRAALVLVGCAEVLTLAVPTRYSWTSTVTGASDGHPVALGSHPALCRVLRESNGVLKVGGRVTAGSLTGPPDIFQTAPLNAGLRMEIGAGAIPGIDIRTRSGALASLGGGERVVAGVPWTFSVMVHGTGLVTLVVNGTSRSTSFDNLAPRCSALLVGGGFDVTRALQGTTSPMECQGGTESPGVPGADVIGSVGVVVLAWVVAGSVAGPRRSRQNRGAA
jgi:hypothetical protein